MCLTLLCSAFRHYIVLMAKAECEEHHLEWFVHIIFKYIIQRQIAEYFLIQYNIATVILLSMFY